MNREQRQALVNELWERDEPQVMIVRYDDAAERIGTRATTTTFWANPIQAIEAFFNLLGDRQYQRHPALNDNFYHWLSAHMYAEEPSADDLVGDVMSDLTEDNTIYHHIISLEIIPLLEYYNRDHGTLAERLEATTDLPLVPMSEYTYGFRDSQPSQSLDGDMLIDVEDVVMFDHSIPPPGLPGLPGLPSGPPSDYSFVVDDDDDDETELFATPTPGPEPLPATNHAPAHPSTSNNNARAHGAHVRRSRVAHSTLDARRIHVCTFQGCSSRFTRPSDLARHWRSLHPGHPQQ